MATIAFLNYSEIVRLPVGVTYKYIFILAKDGNPIIALFTVFRQAATTGPSSNLLLLIRIWSTGSRLAWVRRQRQPTSLSDYRDKKMAAEKYGYWKLFEKEDAAQIVIGSVNPSSPTR